MVRGEVCRRKISIVLVMLSVSDKRRFHVRFLNAKIAEIVLNK